MNKSDAFIVMRIFRIALLAIGLLLLQPRCAWATSNADSDLDGTTDNQEFQDGTDDSNPDSVLEHQGRESCQDWNGFLSDHLQVFEIRNRECGTTGIRVDMYDLTGTVVDTETLTLDASKEFDIIVNDMPGFQRSTYGIICATVTSGVVDALSTQVSYYKASSAGFQYAFSSSRGVGKPGTQYVGYNQYYPTLNLFEFTNTVAEYLEVVPTGPDLNVTIPLPILPDGNLLFYDVDGTLIKTVRLTPQVKSRTDLAVHDLVGNSKVGLIKWQPDDNNALVSIQLNRYYLNADGTYAGMVSIPMRKGSGHSQAAPFSTNNRLAVLELSNTLGSTVHVPVTVYSEAGTATATQPGTISLAPYSTQHVVLSNYLTSGIGNVNFSADTTQGVSSAIIEYGLTSSLRFAYASAGSSSANYGLTAVGGYNNFLGDCRMRLANADSVARSASINMTRYDGTAITIASPITIPANGTTEVDLCDNETQTAYGQVQIMPSVSQAINGEIVRRNQTSDSEFRTPLFLQGTCVGELSTTPKRLTLHALGSPTLVTVTNNSSTLTVSNIQASLPAGFSDVTLDINTCSATLAPFQSCQIRLTPGSSTHNVGIINLRGDNTALTTIPLTVDSQQTTTLTASVSALALSVNDTGTNAALSGNPRTITITNTGSNPATSLTVTPPTFPSGTTLTTTCGSTLAASSTCTVTIIPGSTPTATAGSAPTPGTIQVSGVNTNTVSTSIVVLSYGNIYQGGYLFAIDDSTPTTGSIGGKVAATTDQSSSVFWSVDNLGFSVLDSIYGIDNLSTSASPSPSSGQVTGQINCDGNVDGACNTNNIFVYYQSFAMGSPINISTYAAGLCKQTISGYSDWYLPAICELGFGSGGCGSGASPLTQNMQSNLVDHGNIGNLTSLFYWSSTEQVGLPLIDVYIQKFDTGGLGFNHVGQKYNPFSVRCVRAVVP